MLYKSFRITGEANKTIFDGGLISTVEEPKRLRAILINVSAYHNNTVEGWIETTRILDIPDDICNTSDTSAAITAVISTTKLVRIPIEQDIKPGRIFKIAINCGADVTSIDGSYEYEPIT
ncbi:unnamed protein product [marine sediment metagenome]|uniref:Uncharacterized protein n=1 Tax=marine sediment metagenome TaxID=412755 RepID=X1QLG8_9ZZZZ